MRCAITLFSIMMLLIAWTAMPASACPHGMPNCLWIVTRVPDPPDDNDSSDGRSEGFGTWFCSWRVYAGSVTIKGEMKIDAYFCDALKAEYAQGGGTYSIDYAPGQKCCNPQENHAGSGDCSFGGKVRYEGSLYAEAAGMLRTHSMAFRKIVNFENYEPDEYLCEAKGGAAVDSDEDEDYTFNIELKFGNPEVTVKVPVTVDSEMSDEDTFCASADDTKYYGFTPMVIKTNTYAKTKCHAYGGFLDTDTAFAWIDKKNRLKNRFRVILRCSGCCGARMPPAPGWMIVFSAGY